MRAELIIAGDTLEALVRQGQRHWALEPQFFALDREGAVRYAPVPLDDGDGFSGWLPHRGPNRPFSLDNLAFKELAKAAGLPVPGFSRDPEAARGHVVVRRAGATLGPRFKGPFRTARECPLAEDGGDFYEDHVPGDALTAWFWDGHLICIEGEIAPAVTGDGRSTMGDLMERHPSPRVRSAVAAWTPEREDFLRFHEVTLATVLPPDRAQTVDFAHPRRPGEAGEARLLEPAGKPPPWLEQLAAAGRVLLDAIPADGRASALFVIDGIVDGNGALWLLGTDANPTVHPLLYPIIVRSLLAAGAGAHASAPAA